MTLLEGMVVGRVQDKEGIVEGPSAVYSVVRILDEGPIGEVTVMFGVEEKPGARVKSWESKFLRLMAKRDMKRSMAAILKLRKWYYDG